MKKVLKDARGFTLMEVVVVLGIIALLTAIMMPLILDYVEDARKAKAANDVHSIRVAIHELRQHTRKWPVKDSSNNSLLWLYSGTTAPTDTTLPSGTNVSDSLDNHIVENNAGYATTGKFKWDGSYIDKMTDDPWGNPYVVYVDKLAGTSGKHAWVLSAGPNGDYETAPTDAKLQGDDIGKKIK